MAENAISDGTERANSASVKMERGSGMIVRVPSRPHESDYPWFRVFTFSSLNAWRYIFIRIYIRKQEEKQKKNHSDVPFVPAPHIGRFKVGTELEALANSSTLWFNDPASGDK